MEEALKELIRRKREAMNWTQQDISKLLNMSQPNYAVWESKHMNLQEKGKCNLKCLLNISEEEWANAKVVTQRLIRTNDYERKYANLLNKLAYESDINKVSLNDYKVLKKYLPEALLNEIEDKLDLIGNISTMLEKSNCKNAEQDKADTGGTLNE